MQASGLALPASHVVTLACALADKSAACVRVPLLERGQLRCLDWTEPGLVEAFLRSTRGSDGCLSTKTDDALLAQAATAVGLRGGAWLALDRIDIASDLSFECAMPDQSQWKCLEAQAGAQRGCAEPAGEATRVYPLRAALQAALGGDEPALARRMEALCAAHAEGLRVSIEESSDGQATAPSVVAFVAGALAAARLLQELETNERADEAALIKSILDQYLASKAAACEADSLPGPCAALSAALGPQHSLAPVVHRLAEENASEDAKRARGRAHEIGMRRLAERILEAGDEVGRSETSGALSANVSDPLVARLASEDRIRILKSSTQHLLGDCPEPASNGLSDDSADELLLARRFLEAALTLKRQVRGLGSLQHPVLLPELLALDSVLRADARWRGDAAGLGALVLRVLLDVGEQFASAGRDPLSALLVVESAQRRFARALPLDHRELARAQRLSARLQHQLGASDLRRLQRVRRGTVGEPLLALLVSRLADDALAGKLCDGPCPGGDNPIWVELIGPLH